MKATITNKDYNGKVVNLEPGSLTRFRIDDERVDGDGYEIVIAFGPFGKDLIVWEVTGKDISVKPLAPNSISVKANG